MANAPALDLVRYTCVPYASGKPDANPFFVRAAGSDLALTHAKAETERLGFTHVFVEDASGTKIFDGPIEQAPA